MYLVIKNNNTDNFYPIKEKTKDGFFITPLGKIMITSAGTILLKTEKYRWVPIMAEVRND